MTEQSSRWQPPSRTTLLIALGVVALLNLPMLHYAFFRGAPEAPVTLPFTDDYSDPTTVASRYFSTGAQWRVERGALLGPSPKNNALWLEASVPQDAVIEVDVRAAAAAADVHLELFGDGTDALSGYILVHGASGGTASTMGRLGGFEVPTLQQRLADARAKGLTVATADDLVRVGALRENSPWRLDVQAPPVQAGQVVHHRVERRGNELRWSIDGQLVGTLVDPLPFSGKGHDRIGLSGWETDLSFDNLRVGALSAFGAATAAAPPAAAPTERSAGPFSDTFDRSALGGDWQGLAASEARLVDGALQLSMVHNRPLWLKQPLPDNARVEFRARSLSPEGDLKIEAWGDGVSGYSGDLRLQYTASGYVFIFGGWRNTISALAKQHEHTPDRVERSDLRVEPGRWYLWTIERRGPTVRWFVDGKPFLERTDAEPLSGPTHRFLGLSGWETTVEFDDVKVTPLE